MEDYCCERAGILIGGASRRVMLEEERSEVRLSEVGSLRLAESTGRRVRSCACQLGCWEAGGLAARKVATACRLSKADKRRLYQQYPRGPSDCTLHIYFGSALPTQIAAFS